MQPDVTDKPGRPQPMVRCATHAPNCSTALPGGVRTPSTTRTHPRGMVPAWAGHTGFRPGLSILPAVRVGARGGHDANGPHAFRMGPNKFLCPLAVRRIPWIRPSGHGTAMGRPYGLCADPLKSAEMGRNFKSGENTRKPTPGPASIWYYHKKTRSAH